MGYAARWLYRWNGLGVGDPVQTSSCLQFQLRLSAKRDEARILEQQLGFGLTEDTTATNPLPLLLHRTSTSAKGPQHLYSRT